MERVLRKGKVFLVMGLAALLLLVPVAATAATEETVAATVTPAYVAVTVTEGNLAYGILAALDTNKIPTGPGTTGDASFTINNTGSVPGSFSLVGGASTAWAIAAAAASETYAHRYSITPLAGGTPGGTSLNTSTSISIGGGASQDIWLQLDMPTATTATEEQSLPITVTVTMP